MKIQLVVAETNLENLRTSSLASYRLRLANVYEAAKSLGMEVVGGLDIDQTANLYFVGKITAAFGERQVNSVLSGLEGKNQIILDYTDHWLEKEKSSTGHIYKKLADISNLLVTPVKRLTDSLISSGYSAVTVFDGIDAYKALSPTQTSKKKREVLWFGHSSNIHSLIRLLSGYLNHYDFNLTLVTNKQSFDILRTTNFKTTPRCKVKGVLWSRDNLLAEAIKADFCILPVDKEFASQNRLVTAFRLGLPVLAENISSYEPYGDCYAKMSLGAVKEMFNNPEVWHTKVIEAQQRIIKDLDADVLVSQWVTALKNH